MDFPDSPLSIVTCSNQRLLPADLPVNIQGLYKADVNKLLLIWQHWRNHMTKVHKRSSFVSSSLILQQCPAYLLHFNQMFIEMDRK